MRAAAIAWFMTGLWTFPCIGIGDDEGDDVVSDFLTENGTLKETLILKDGQEGFVGISGEIVTVEPSGAWTVARFVNERTQEPHRRGQLDREQRERLAEVLAGQDFTQLPSQFGRDIEINRHLLEIRFGEKKAVLVLDAGESLQEASPPLDDSDASAWKRFITVGKAIKAETRAQE